MSLIRIEQIGGKSVERAEKLLAGIPKGIDKALKSATTRTTSFLRTQSTKRIRERYDITKSAVRANENVEVKYSYQNGVSAVIYFAGMKIPLYRYNGAEPKEPTPDKSKKVRAMISGQWRYVHPSVAASGHILNGTSPTRFENAFVAQMKSGHTGIFERTGRMSYSDGDEIRELMGLSVPQMLGNQEVVDKLAEDADSKFEERMDHEITRILNGWGV